MTSGEIVGLITGILTIIGVIVATTRYVTQLQFKVRQERLEAEKEGLEKRFGDIEARYKELLNEIEISRRVGTASLTRKKDIDDTLLSIMKAMFAEAGSIFIPLRSLPSSDPSGLVFLSIQPMGKKAMSLKRKIIPMQSSAGRCFRTGRPYTSPNPKIDPQHYGKAQCH